MRPRIGHGDLSSVLGTTIKTSFMTNTHSDPSAEGQRSLTITFIWLAVLFCICLVTANILEPRLWKVGPFPFQLTGGVVIFPVSYIINDCLTEVYGYRKARLVIWMGFAMCFFVAVVGGIVTLLPDPLYPESQGIADSFNQLFGLVPRTMVGSLLAFISGSTVNAWVMSKMKVATKGKGFGWRAILSSIAGEIVDSVIFFPIAFGGLLPFRGVIGLMITQVVVKTGYEVVILPVTNYVVKKLKEFDGADTYDEGISYNPFRIKDI